MKISQKKILFPTLLAVGTGIAVPLVLGGCGQKGALFLPQTPAAADRATLPQAVRSALPGGSVGGTDTGNSPTPALPAPAASVTAPTPAPALPPPYTPLTPLDSVPAFPSRR